MREKNTAAHVMCITIGTFWRQCKRTLTLPNVNGKPALAFNWQVLLVLTSDFDSADYRKESLVYRMFVNIYFKTTMGRVHYHGLNSTGQRSLLSEQHFQATPECFASWKISCAWEGIWNPSECFGKRRHQSILTLSSIHIVTTVVNTH